MTHALRVRTIAIVLVMAIGAVAWATGIRQRFFDYDEIYHAHAVWLIAQGSRPFHDFFGSHSPLLWYAAAPLWRILPDAPSALVPLRVVAAIGTVLSIVAMALAWWSARRELPAAWLLVGIAAIAFHHDVLDFGLEFRPDSWSTALLFLAFVLFLTRRPASIPLRCALFGCLASLGVLSSPKLFLLPVLFVAIDALYRVRRREPVAMALLGYAGGLAAALLLVVALLRVAHVDPWLTFQMAIHYQASFVSHSAFRHGLLDSVLRHPHLLILVVAGVSGWCAHLITTRRRPEPYEIAVVLFLALQCVIVDRPYKQYYGPWFLLAAGFVPFAGLHLERTFPRAGAWCFGLAIALSGATAWGAGQSFAHDQGAQQMLAFYETIVRRSAPEAAIVAYPPLHPVVRRDVFYGWNRTTDPAGYGTERIMRSLAVPGYSERFEAAYYRRELDARQPAAIVAPVNDDWGYEPMQWAAVRDFLAEHRERYVLLDRGLIAPVWIRRER